MGLGNGKMAAGDGPPYRGAEAAGARSRSDVFCPKIWSFPFLSEKSYTRILMRTLYFDCFAGASGNMILGAIIAAGVDIQTLTSAISKLGFRDFELNTTTVKRSGISAVHVNVKVPDERSHRNLPEIVRVIDSSGLSALVKERSVAIFTRLAEAEAAVHGIDVQEVHFHEVGAMDAIIDIVGACVGFELLGIERFACSKIHVGGGFVEMAHGRFPVPPPAVTELLKGFTIYSDGVEGELITPTGAAIISTLCESCEGLLNVKGEIVAYGAGSRDYDSFPNALRIIIGSTVSQNEANVFDSVSSLADGFVSRENLFILETNIDDTTPQVLGFVMERAFELGALDCWFAPIQMKKNRPAIMLSVLCRAEDRDALTGLVYRETTTLGIRVRPVERECLEREIVAVDTKFGKIDVKLARLNGRVVTVMPEYEQVKRRAVENGASLRDVKGAALDALDQLRLAAGR